MALYLGNNKVKLNAYSGDYKFKDGKLIWANPDLYLRQVKPYNPYISSGFIPNSNTSVEVAFTYTVFPAWQIKTEITYPITNLGAYLNVNNFSLSINDDYGGADHYAAVWWAGGRGGYTRFKDLPHFIPHNKYVLTASGKGNTYQYLKDANGNILAKGIYPNDIDTTGHEVDFKFPFNGYGADSYTEGQSIFYVKIWDGDTLARNFVPVPKGLQIGDFTVPSNGMFDIVEQTFYEKRGTGDFEFGKNSPYIITDGKLIGTSTNTTHIDFSGSQYLQIPYKANNNTKVNIGVSTNKKDANQAIICSRTLANKNSFTMFFLGQDGTRLRSDYGTEQAHVGNYVANTKYNIVKDKNITYINNTVVNTATETEFTAQTDTYIGVSNYVGGSINNYLYGSVYFCKIYENDVLLYDLVPVYKGLQIGDFTVPSNGMFDMVNQKFYANQGTGELGFSNDIVQNDASFSKVNVHTMQGDYLIKDGKLLWANPDLYIASTGQPYIDTGYICNTNTKVDCVFSPTSIDTFPTTQTHLFGTGGKYLSTNMFNFHYWIRAGAGDSVWWPYIGTSGSGSAISNFAWEMCEKYKVIMNGKTNGPQELYYNNGELIKSFSTNNGFTGSQNTLFLFKLNGYEGKETAKKRIYSFKIYEDDVLIHNFVPVPAGLQIGSFTVPSNGMFDIVEQKFYANQGTGEFEFGGNQSDYVISDGKLLWASKKLKLYIPGTWGQSNITKISTGVFLDEISGFEYKTATITGEQCNYIGVNNTTDSKYYLSTYGLVRYDEGINDDFSNNTTFLLYSFRDTPQTKGSLEQYNTNISAVGDGWYSEVKMVDDNTWKFIGTFVEETKDFSGTDIPHYEILLGTTINTRGPDGPRYSTRWVRYYKLFNKDGNLVRYFVPVKKGLAIGTYTTPAVGMFDIVEQKFYGNEGTGEFLINKDE